jgi:hypothetical protein
MILNKLFLELYFFFVGNKSTFNYFGCLEFVLERSIKVALKLVLFQVNPLGFIKFVENMFVDNFISAQKEFT